ncbi:hypothetical protein PVAND_014338 [Polypedilum vanderplanki]|uniref:RNase H type-1 domain-containing protein n=1 Tax=Polypedilum vanderplanki TaxID=319348 RepID=A0A9J6CSG1_POLVA|nr:hypothetical protein PVAND_014338 [Polypedilum vanderplanki]
MVVLPVLTYGAVVWWEKSHQVSVMAKLDHLQRLALLAITGAMSTTPTAALEMIIGLVPLNIRIEAVARAELYRLHCWQQFNSSRELTGHARLWNRMVVENPFWMAPSDCMEGVLIQLGADIVLFTDGSLCNNLAGAGVYSASFDVRLSFCLGRNISIFQAEIFAISVAVSHCLEIGVRDRKVVFCVDSQSPLLSLRSNKFQSKLVFECVGLLNSLARDNDVTLVWVPGHSDISGNEKVDELARLGSKELGTGVAPCLPLSRSWAAETIRDWSRMKNLERWLKLSSCSQTKCFITKPLASGDITQIRNLEREYTKEAFIRVAGNKAENQVEMACENFEHINKDLRTYYLKLLNDWHKSPDFNAKMLGRASELFDNYYSQLKNRHQVLLNKCNTNTAKSNPETNAVPDQNSSIDTVPNLSDDIVPNSDPKVLQTESQEQKSFNNTTVDPDKMPEYSQEDWENFEKESLKRSSTKSSSDSFNTNKTLDIDEKEPDEKVKKFE